MPEDGAVNELRDLDAIASESGAVLAFRMEEASPQLEPVFLRIFSANEGAEHEVALIEIGDQRGLSLGRYVVNRERLEQALARAEEIDEQEPEPAVVPSEWECD